MIWKSVEFQDVVDGKSGLKRGPFGGAIKKEIFVTDGYKIYEQKNAIYNDFELGNYYIDENKFRELKGFEVKPFDLLVSCSGTIGKVAIVPTNAKQGIINQALLRIRPDTSLIDIVYLKRLLETPKMQRELFESASGSAIKNVKPLDQIRKSKIPLPPLPEQKRIAEVLDKADALREKRRLALQKLDTLLQSVFLEMFGDPVKNPKGWETHSLEDVCQKITDGTHFSPPIQKEGIPYITAKHLKPYGLDFESKPWFISVEHHREIYSRCDPKKGDILYIKDGATTGIAAINYYDFEFSMLSSLALLRPKAEVCTSEFLCEWLNNPIVKLQMLDDIAGAAITRLTLTKIKRKKILVPPLELQKQFSEKIRKIKSLNQIMEKSLVSSSNLFQSLQQRAFKGELFNDEFPPVEPQEENVLRQGSLF